MDIELKNSNDFIRGFIQGEYKQNLKIKEVLEYIKENIDFWSDNEIFKEFIENIERILKQ